MEKLDKKIIIILSIAVTVLSTIVYLLIPKHKYSTVNPRTYTSLRRY